jgi:hypothetical protein
LGAGKPLSREGRNPAIAGYLVTRVRLRLEEPERILTFHARQNLIYVRTMSMKNLIVITLMASMFAGCATKRISPGHTPETVKRTKSIAVIEPVIDFYEIGIEAKTRLSGYEGAYRTDIASALSGFLERTNSAYYNAVDLKPGQADSVRAFLDSSLFYSRRTHTANVPDILMEIGKEDHVLFIYFYGYYKTDSKSRREFWKSIGIGLLTLGFYIPIYQKEFIGMDSFLVDKKSREVVYHDYVATSGNLREFGAVRRLLDKSIVDYFGEGQNR